MNNFKILLETNAFNANGPRFNLLMFLRNGSFPCRETATWYLLVARYETHPKETGVRKLLHRLSLMGQVNDRTSKKR